MSHNRRYVAYVNSAERSAIDDLDLSSPGRLLRAVLYLMDQDPDLEQRVRTAASKDERLADGSSVAGQHKGYGEDDYASAIQESGSLAGAARILDVHSSTVREMAKIHEIEVASIGGVPE